METFECNPRQISEEEFQQLEENLRELGDLSGIVHDRNTDMIIGGNQRSRVFDINSCEITITERFEEPTDTGTVAHGFVVWEGEKYAYRKVDWTAQQCKKANITANKLGGDWDWDELANYFDVEDLTDWGFSDEELFGDGLYEDEKAHEDDYEVPDEDEIETEIQLGDLIEIGRHRLLCGDSTDEQSVKHLIGGGKVMLLVTDPPYGVSVDHSWRDDVKNRKPSPRGGEIKNDDRSDWEETYKNFDAQIAYVWHGALFADVVKNNLESAGYDVRQQIIWVKSVHALSRSAYHWKHEPCWYAVKKGENGNWLGDRKQMTVWDADSPIMSTSHNEDATNHPTQKPIIAASKPIQNHTTEEDIIADGFLASGTTMAAAHQLDRTCYGMELDPKYCQVIVDRMLSLDPTLKVKINGEPYE